MLLAALANTYGLARDVARECTAMLARTRRLYHVRMEFAMTQMTWVDGVSHGRLWDVCNDQSEMELRAKKRGVDHGIQLSKWRTDSHAYFHMARGMVHGVHRQRSSWNIDSTWAYRKRHGLKHSARVDDKYKPSIELWWRDVHLLWCE